VMEPAQKPDPGPELARLGPMIGTWSGTAEMVSPSPEEVKKTMPEGSGRMGTAFKGGGKFEWALDGMFLKGEGWHEMGDGRRIRYVEYITWDPKAKKYRNWWFNDWGSHGQGGMAFDPDETTLRVKTETVNAQGAPTHRERTMTLVDDNTMEWTWSEDGPMGKIKLKGTSRRQP
jgi:hypothetical protein